MIFGRQTLITTIRRVNKKKQVSDQEKEAERGQGEKNEEKDTSNRHNEIVISLDLGLFFPQTSMWRVCVCFFSLTFLANNKQQ